MQAASDIFLGWQRVKGIDGETRDYYLRQLHDWKGSAEVETSGPKGRPSTRGYAGRRWPRHARWGDRIAIASYLGKGEVSTRRSPTSPPPTPTRTSATTRPSPAP